MADTAVCVCVCEGVGEVGRKPEKADKNKEVVGLGL